MSFEWNIEVPIPEGATKAEEQRIIDAAVDAETEKVADAALKALGF